MSSIIRENIEIKRNVSVFDTLKVLSVWAYLERNVCNLYITPVKYCYIKTEFDLNDSKTIIFYYDDTKSYGSGGIFIKPEKVFFKFKKDKFTLGDTLYGFMDLKTNSYLRNNIEFIDKYKGYFASIIVPKDTFMKYQWLR